MFLRGLNNLKDVSSLGGQVATGTEGEQIATVVLWSLSVGESGGRKGWPVRRSSPPDLKDGGSLLRYHADILT